MESYSSEAARREWRRILNKVDHGERVEVTRYGEPVAVVVPADWYRNVLAIQRGIHAFTHDTDGNRLHDESELPVGELMSAIGEAAIEGLETDR